MKAALGAKVVPNSGSANSLSAGADAADAALAALKGSPGSSAHDSNTAAAALAGSPASKPPNRSIRDWVALIAFFVSVQLRLTCRYASTQQGTCTHVHM